jgi:hypothetical protein
MHSRKHALLLAAAALLTAGDAARGHAAPPPAPWTSRDIGVFSAPGSVDVDARGFWTLRGFQGELPLSPDAYFFVYQPLAGDGSVLSLLLAEEGGNPDVGRAGVAIIEREAARARAAGLQMTTGRGLAFTFRREDVLPAVLETGDRIYGPRRFPTWLRLQREGNYFTPFTSTDGFGWTQLRSPVLLPGFPSSALAGLTVASAYGGPVSGIFSNPVVAPGLTSPIAQACAGTGTVLLTWPPVKNAAGYMVRRSAPNTPGFAADVLTPSPIKETSFTDSNRPNGQPARYLVSAVFDQGGQGDGRLPPVEGWVTAVMATPVSIPGGLFGCDVNLESTQLRGGVVFDPATGVYKISGSGGEIGGDEDHFFYVSQSVKGDFQVTARILDRPARTNEAAKAGVMVREALDGPARMAFLAGTAATGVLFQYRQEMGGEASAGRPVIANADFKPPLFLRLVRRGNTITPFVSTDGSGFTPAGNPQTVTSPLPESLYVGYAITAQNASALTANTFSDLSIGPAP